MIQNLEHAITRGPRRRQHLVQLVEAPHRFVNHGAVGEEADKISERKISASRLTLDQQGTAHPHDGHGTQAADKVGARTMDRPAIHRLERRILQVTRGGLKPATFAIGQRK